MTLNLNEKLEHTRLENIFTPEKLENIYNVVNQEAEIGSITISSYSNNQPTQLFMLCPILTDIRKYYNIRDDYDPEEFQENIKFISRFMLVHLLNGEDCIKFKEYKEKAERKGRNKFSEQYSFFYTMGAFLKLAYINYPGNIQERIKRSDIIKNNIGVFNRKAIDRKTDYEDLIEEGGKAIKKIVNYRRKEESPSTDLEIAFNQFTLEEKRLFNAWFDENYMQPIDKNKITSFIDATSEKYD